MCEIWYDAEDEQHHADADDDRRRDVVVEPPDERGDDHHRHRARHQRGARLRRVEPEDLLHEDAARGTCCPSASRT